MFSALFAASIIDKAIGYMPPYSPHYCAKDIASDELKPLNPMQAKKVSRLIQVQSFFRHGSRIPWQKNSCWKNYNIDWSECDVFMLNLPQRAGVNSVSEKVYFRKKYDGSANQFSGNCMIGQLVGEGYEQEMTLGKLLRNRYAGNSSFGLFNSNSWSSELANQVYFRSDDDTRTLMSGQLILSSLFDFSRSGGAVIDLHTGEYSLDWIYPNSKICPRLVDLTNAAYSSIDYQERNSSQHVNGMVDQLNAIFGGSNYWSWNTYLDCVMTSICTGRDIPDGSHDNSSIQMNDKLFYDALVHVEWSWAFVALHNQSAYAKLAMSPLLAQVRSQMLQAISNYSSIDTVKLALYASHDTTIQSLLAALLGDRWKGQWSRYAALLVIEVYQGVTQRYSSQKKVPYYFRMLYDQTPILFPGCSDTLCDVEILFHSLSFATSSPFCDSTPSAPSNDATNMTSYGSSFTKFLDHESKIHEQLKQYFRGSRR